MKTFYKVSLLVLIFTLTLGLAGLALAATTINLSTADNFAVLGGSTITNTGSSVVNGDIGLSPGTAVTGFPPGTTNGTQHVADASAVQAQADLTVAYSAAGQTPVTTVPTELGGTTLTAGVYDSADGTFSITGTLTLNAQGDPNAVFIFRTASTLITAGGSSVVLANGAQACNIFWQVGSSATLGTNSAFKGNILAFSSITLTTGASVDGRVLARNGAVTLDTNTITKATCVAPVIVPTTTPTPTTTPITPAETIAPTPTEVPTAVSAPESTETVLAPTPKLPNTGIAPDNTNSFLWNIIIPTGVLTAIFSLYLVLKKRTI